MKYIYYFTSTACLLIFIILMILSSGGGFHVIFFLIETGFYGKNIFTINNIPYDDLYVIWLNRLIGAIFWCCIFINIGLLFFKKINIKTKGKISLVCLIILLLIIFVPKIF